MGFPSRNQTGWACQTLFSASGSARSISSASLRQIARSPGVCALLYFFVSGFIPIPSRAGSGAMPATAFVPFTNSPRGELMPNDVPLSRRDVFPVLSDGRPADAKLKEPQVAGAESLSLSPLCVAQETADVTLPGRHSAEVNRQQRSGCDLKWSGCEPPSERERPDSRSEHPHPVPKPVRCRSRPLRGRHVRADVPHLPRLERGPRCEVHALPLLCFQQCPLRR